MKTTDEYDSSWQWTVERSNYHFDKWRADADQEWFTRLGRFTGDWQAEIDDIKAKAAPMNWENRKFYGKDNPNYSPMLQQEERDITQAGGDPKMTITHMWDELDGYPVLQNIVNYFEIEQPKVRIHIQKLGDMFNMHIDKLWDIDPDPDNVIRLTVMLEDWEPGQFYMYGNYMYDRWRAGDAHIFDWRNVPHATANASRKIRPTLQVTGRKTDKTRFLLSRAGADVRYYV